MSGIDLMFVYTDTPVTPMEVAYACIFEPTTAPGGYSYEAVRRVLAARIPALAPFRRRLMAVPFGLDHPRWVDDPDFALDNHLHRVALPAPGGKAEFAVMVAAVMGRPLSPHQPPWEMHIVEGFAGGQVGLIAKVHHAVIDGVAGVQLMAQLLDLTAEGRPVAAVCPPWLPAALPSGARLVRSALPSVFASPVRALHAAREVGRTAVRLARCALDGESAPLSIPLGAPTTFETPVGASRSVSLAELDLRQVRQLKERFGVTVNDVILALCSGALRQHLHEHHEESSLPLVAVVPVSVRGGPDGDLGNRLSAMFIPLANDLADPLERIRAIAATSASAKAQERAVGYGPMASALSEAVPPALARPVIRLGTRVGALRRLRAGNLMISNVPGPDFSLYFAGMEMVAAYPLGPVIDGVALNITVQSYGEVLFVGINAATTAVPDLPALARGVVGELALMMVAAERDDEGAAALRVKGPGPSYGTVTPLVTRTSRQPRTGSPLGRAG